MNVGDRNYLKTVEVMCSTGHLITVAIILTLISGLSAGDWRGFHGLEKEGRCDSAIGPLNWSSSQCVVWKTAIPGRGHSSPILSGSQVYLTTAYERSQLSSLQKVWKYTIFALTLFFTLIAVKIAVQSLEAKKKIKEVLQHLRFFVFVLLLSGVTIVIFFGFYLLNLDDDPARAWLTSMIVMLSCLMISLIFIPLRSCKYLVASLLSLMFAFPAFLTLRHKDLVCGFSSFKGLIMIITLLSPLVVGLALLMGYLLSHRRQSRTILNLDNVKKDRSEKWHFWGTGSIGFLVSLTLFFLLLYRAADYQMPDSIIWHNRFRPDVSWWCISLYAILVLVTIAGCFWKSVRLGILRRFPLQEVFLVLALALGVAFFIDVNFVERQEESVRAVICLDRDNGTVRWICEGLLGQKGRGESRVVTHASPTPVTDSERIYGYFGKDGLMCVNSQGKLLWKKTEPMFHSKFGVGTSPVLKDNVLIVVKDEKETDKVLSYITAFDCLSGQPLWEKKRRSHKVDAGYSTPLIKTLNGREVVIVHGWYDIKGYDLKTGQELWSYPINHEGRHLVASMVSDAKRLYVTGAKKVTALDLSKFGTKDDPFVWFSPIQHEKSSTPVVFDGLLFLVTEAGIAFCLDAETGEVTWKERLQGRYFSSVVAMGNKIFFTNESGQTTVVANDRKYEQLAINRMGESVYASFAPMGDQFFVRTSKNLYCIQADRQ